MSNSINAHSHSFAAPATNGTQTEALPSAKGLTQAFKHRDANGDGKLTTADFKNGKIPPGLLKKFDTNNDGAITLAEFLNRGHHGTHGKPGELHIATEKKV